MTAERYARSAVVLHWAIALALGFQLGMGWYMVDLPPGSGQFAAFQLHKSVGITVLLLSVARLLLRFGKPRPQAVVAGPLARAAAATVHVLLYVFMIGGPITGWAVVSTARIVVPTRVFGLVPWPHLPLGQGWNGLAEALHAQLSWLGLALILLHIVGAVRHHVGRERSNVLGRMIPMLKGAGDGDAPSVGRSLLAAGGATLVLALCFLLPWMGGSAPPPAVPAAAHTDGATVPAAADPVTPDLPASIGNEVAAASGSNEDVPGKEETPVTAPSSWRVLPGGRLGFTASMNGAGIVGRFRTWSAKILFSPDALADSRIEVRVGLLSADTSDGSRDDMLRGSDFFGSAGNEAVYTSRAITRIGEDRYRVDGSLRMNGKSLSVPLSVTIRIDGDRASASGSAQLDRTMFGIGRGDWAGTEQIAAKVDVSFVVRAQRVGQKP